MEKIKLILGSVLGVILSFSNEFIPNLNTENTMEEIVETNCCDVYILDSLEFANAADSVLLYGNENSYTNLLLHYSCLDNGSNDLLFYSIVIANKHPCSRGPYEVYKAISHTVESYMGMSLLSSDMMKFYLLYGAKLGDSQCYYRLEEFYEDGILFKKDKRKAKFYENKIKEIKWIE